VSDHLLPRLLQLIGLGFLVVNVRLLALFAQFWRVRRSAQLTWPARRPPFYGLGLLLGVVLGTLVVVKVLLQQRPMLDAFGELMMCLYYGYLVPLTLRIGRGFYAGGIWFEGGFLPYSKIGGMSWRSGPDPVLVMIRRGKAAAYRLVVPQRLYGQARRVLRDRIAEHDIHYTTDIQLQGHDERDDV
jgi:hypothetical protein